MCFGKGRGLKSCSRRSRCRKRPTPTKRKELLKDEVERGRQIVDSDERDGFEG